MATPRRGEAVVVFDKAILAGSLSRVSCIRVGEVKFVSEASALFKPRCSRAYTFKGEYLL